MNWRDFIQQPNPAALALLGQMGYNPKEKVQIKLDFLRMLVKMQLDPARQKLVSGFFEQYLVLNDAEKEQLNAQIENIPKDEVNQIMELMTSWEKEGYEKGIEKGIKKGVILTAKKMLDRGVQIKDIQEFTGLSEEQILKLKEQLNE